MPNPHHMPANDPRSPWTAPAPTVEDWGMESALPFLTGVSALQAPAEATTLPTPAPWSSDAAN